MSSSRSARVAQRSAGSPRSSRSRLGPGPRPRGRRPGSKVRATSQVIPRCTSCPAVCPLAVVQTAPDRWRTEYPDGEDGCLCPRGSALGDLVAHPRRLLAPRCRVDDRWQAVSETEALDRILAAAGSGLTILLDGNLSCEQILAAAAWCKAWDQAQLSLVIEPADQQLLLGTEASGAEYLSGLSLPECDGFLIIGGALGANPACARGLLDRRKAEPATPLVVIDPGTGVAVKFATHRVDCPPGGELASLVAVAASAGVRGGDLGQPSAPQVPSATAAGEVLARCKRLGVLIAAEYGRTSLWREIGLLAGRLAKAKGGAVAVQTAGANALAAVRLAAALGTVPLAQALAAGPGMRVAIGCDVLGMLGWTEQGRMQAAAAALPNRTVELAEVALPLALAEETGGTVLGDGAQQFKTAALLAPPAGVLTAAGLVEAMARRAGVTARASLPQIDISSRITASEHPAVLAGRDPDAPVLLLGRQAAHAGCGALTGFGAWQAAAHGEPDLDLAGEDAQRMGLKNRQVVSVRAGKRSVRARLRVASDLAPGVAVLSEGFAQSRALMPARIDEAGALTPVRVSKWMIHPEASASA